MGFAIDSDEWTGERGGEAPLDITGLSGGLIGAFSPLAGATEGVEAPEVEFDVP